MVDSSDRGRCEKFHGWSFLKLDQQLPVDQVLPCGQIRSCHVSLSSTVTTFEVFFSTGDLRLARLTTHIDSSLHDQAFETGFEPHHIAPRSRSSTFQPFFGQDLTLASQPLVYSCDGHTCGLSCPFTCLPVPLPKFIVHVPLVIPCYPACARVNQSRPIRDFVLPSQVSQLAQELDTTKLTHSSSPS